MVSTALLWKKGPESAASTSGGVLNVLSPGERAEVLVRLTPGERVVLRSQMTAEAAGMVAPVAALNGDTDAFDVLEVRAADTLAPANPVPERLATIEPFDDADVATTRTFRLSDSFEINGESMDMNRIDETVTVDTLERWLVTNETDVPHSFHVHDVQFQIVDRSRGPLAANELGRKDTVTVNPRETVRIMMRFADFADPHTPYMFHCHLLQHEDQGMMGQFVVVAA